MVLHIKNMVCHRCKMAVRAELEKLGAVVQSVELGEVALAEDLPGNHLAILSENLRHLGFEIMDDRRSVLIEKIRTLIIELVHQQDNNLKINLSDYLTSHLHHDYHYLSTLFSEVEGTTIEKFHIAQKIERVKELLVYDEMTLSEIAFRLNYSSVAHLSNQFKKATGLTPSFFKNLKHKNRKPLDEV